MQDTSGKCESGKVGKRRSDKAGQKNLFAERKAAGYRLCILHSQALKGIMTGWTGLRQGPSIPCTRPF